MKFLHYGILSILFVSLGSGCMRVPKNSLDLYQRSVVIENPETEQEILSKASVSISDDPALNNIRVLHLKGTPYEMGFQHGRLLKDDVRACINYVIKRVKYYATEDMMDEVYDLMAPYIPIEEKEEMRGLAHGADLPLKVVHWFHSIPEVSEYGPKKRFQRNLVSTSCSNIVAFGNATQDKQMYQLRVLDWNRRLGVQKWPVVLVHHPDKGNASVTLSFAGFIGCVSGMNEKKIVLGEMGYGSPPGETLEGTPFVFMFRKILREANSLTDADTIIRNAQRTCSYVYMISDTKIREGSVNALLYITDKDRVITHQENTLLIDERNGKQYPAFDDVLYAGPREKLLLKNMTRYYGNISVEALQDIAKNVSLLGNIQNVIFKPETLELWVSNASNAKKDLEGKASHQKWFHFDFGRALKKKF